MPTPTDPLGLYLRSLRRSRHMTMRNVDAIVSISPSVISRLEHGERSPTRHECILLSRAYGLGAYETHRLFSMAGFLPEPQPVGSQEGVRAIAEQVLVQLRYPAVLIDPLGNVQAWNTAMDAIWKPSRASPVHVLDDLFKPYVRKLLGKDWRAYVARSIWVFMQRALGNAHDKAYRDTLQRLEERHGIEFVEMLEEANELTSPDPEELAQLGLTMQHESPVGTIRYVVTQVMLHTSAGLEVYVHLPLGDENLERFHAFAATLGPNQVHLGSR